MSESDVYTSSSGGALRQGEIVSGLVQYIIVGSGEENSSELVDVRRVVHPLAVAMSQDCDLAQDFGDRSSPTPSRRRIPSVLFCEATEAATMRGNEGINSELWRRIKKNADERYHFLEQIEGTQDALGEGMPEIGIDFKRYFTVPTDDVYGQLSHEVAKRRCRLLSPYVEHLCTRFFVFQSRIALPRDHRVSPPTS